MRKTLEFSSCRNIELYISVLNSVLIQSTKSASLIISCKPLIEPKAKLSDLCGSFKPFLQLGLFGMVANVTSYLTFDI